MHINGPLPLKPSWADSISPFKTMRKQVTSASALANALSAAPRCRRPACPIGCRPSRLSSRPDASASGLLGLAWKP
eukprot:6275574-Amphidinium_carterae.1